MLFEASIIHFARCRVYAGFDAAQAAHLQRLGPLEQLGVVGLGDLTDVADDAAQVPNGFDANDVIKTAYNRFGVSLGLGQGPVNGKVFRICHLGYVNEVMVLAALGGVEMALKSVGVPIKAGAGVGAAVSYYCENPARS